MPLVINALAGEHTDRQIATDRQTDCYRQTDKHTPMREPKQF